MTVEISGAVQVKQSPTVKATETITQSALTVTEFSSTQISVAPSTTDLALPTTLINPGSYLFLESDKDINVKLNSSATAFTLLAGGKLSMNATITAVSVTNSSVTDTAVVKMIIAG